MEETDFLDTTRVLHQSDIISHKKEVINIMPGQCNTIICDRIWENPAYGINAQFTQCTFLVPQVKNDESPDFVISMSNNPSSKWRNREQSALSPKRSARTASNLQVG